MRLRIVTARRRSLTQGDRRHVYSVRESFPVFELSFGNCVTESREAIHTLNFGVFSTYGRRRLAGASSEKIIKLTLSSVSSWALLRRLSTNPPSLGGENGKNRRRLCPPSSLHGAPPFVFLCRRKRTHTLLESGGSRERGKSRAGSLRERTPCSATTERRERVPLTRRCSCLFLPTVP